MHSLEDKRPEAANSGIHKVQNGPCQIRLLSYFSFVFFWKQLSITIISSIEFCNEFAIMLTNDYHCFVCRLQVLELGV